MENKFSCPICHKTGIPDFRNENVVCPCCGTDLSVYRTINAAQKSSERISKLRVLSAIASLIALAAIISCCYLYNRSPRDGSDNKDLLAKIDTLKQENKLLLDSIVVLNDQGAATNRRTYTVVKGDCPWEISKKVYGDGRRYEEILRLNGISNAEDFNKVKIGETLFIE